ncbi:regulator [Nocardia speluncae]|uniref:Regulator n=2 Tax=Nocardia speluncae TaxID=419477 RepID=A0A846XNT7_9NOCA|nr:regulator [Nocardia speluncae]
MFGMLRPCRHGAAKYGIDPGLWQSHMCGLCLGLRDGGGQVARAATNTDAIVLSLLTEAQAETPALRRTAGPCPLRGMRAARVPVGAAAPVRLAATASLLLGSAKVRDHIDDGDLPARLHRPMRRIATGWSAGAHAHATGIGLDIEPLVAAIEAQASTEQRIAAAPGPSGTADLDDLTVASRRCAAEFFAHTAVLAGRPDNTEPLRAAGAEFGRIAHLADALTDYTADAAARRFNPLAATSTPPADAYHLVRESDRALRESLRTAGLTRMPALRWALLDPLTTAVRRLGAAFTTRVGAFPGDIAGTRNSAGQDAPPRRPGARESIQLVLTQYCTGYACCAEHTNPCSGEQRQSWAARCCDCKSCCDCAGCCSDCGGCCGGDGCCCGCCDCSC